MKSCFSLTLCIAVCLSFRLCLSVSLSVSPFLPLFLLLCLCLSQFFNVHGLLTSSSATRLSISFPLFLSLGVFLFLSPFFPLFSYIKSISLHPTFYLTLSFCFVHIHITNINSHLDIYSIATAKFHAYPLLSSGIWY